MWAALLAQDLGASAAARVLLFLRGYGGRARAEPAGEFPERLARFGFVPLSQSPGEELVFGLAGRFWRPGGGLRPLASAAAFREFHEEGCVKTAWNLRLEDLGGGRTLLWTETRVEPFGAAARRRFRLYWSVIAPFSGMIRRALLSGVRRRAEAP